MCQWRNNQYRVFAVLILVAAWAMSAQQMTAQESGRFERVADGKADPESIPDRVAYLLLFRSLSDADPANVDSDRTAFLESRAGLGAVDRKALIEIAQEFRQETEDLMAAREKVASELAEAPGSPERTAALQQGRRLRDAAVQTARDAVQKRLSADGARKLDEFVRMGVKPNVTISRPLP